MEDTTDSDDLITLAEEDSALDIRPDSFVPRSGFLRSGGSPHALPRAAPGPPWSFDEADRQAHQFLRALAGERVLEHHHDDPVDHARANDLMLLFGEDAQDAFETLLVRMPEPRADAWRELLGGGASSEAFGPLTLQERLDEHQVEEALQSGRRQRIISLIVGTVLLVIVAGGAVLAWNTLLTDEERTEGTLRFGDTADDPVQAATAGGAPVAEPRLTEALTTTVAVLAGDGPAGERITTAPFSDFPHPPGALRASLFRYAGSGHVVVVGPDGFTGTDCLRASVVTADLRPLDLVTHGPCADSVGRPADVGCLGPSAVLLALDVPSGEVALPEGGSGFADAVRVQLIGADDRYEVLSLRAAIEVAVGEEVEVPSFGGSPGDEITFDLGADRVGTCTLTGDLLGVS